VPDQEHGTVGFSKDEKPATTSRTRETILPIPASEKPFTESTTTPRIEPVNLLEDSFGTGLGQQIETRVIPSVRREA
jgi:hypothetical protein